MRTLLERDRSRKAERAQLFKGQPAGRGSSRSRSAILDPIGVPVRPPGQSGAAPPQLRPLTPTKLFLFEEAA